MSYEKTTWVNGETPVDAQNMNKIENELAALDTGKVDIEQGKGLSSNDYTNAEKAKLDEINMTTKVDKVEGKGLSSNDYTDDDKHSLVAATQTLDDILDGSVKAGGAVFSDVARNIESAETKAALDTAELIEDYEVAIAPTGAGLAIDTEEEGADATLMTVYGNSTVEGEYANATCVLNSVSTEPTITYTVDEEKLTIAAKNSLVAIGNAIPIATVKQYEEYGIVISGQEQGTETFKITAPSFQTVEFPVIYNFNSTTYNLLDSTNHAYVIEGVRYQIFTAGMVSIDGVSQVIEEDFESSSGNVIPYSFVASKTGKALYTGGTVLARVGTGKYYNRTTHITYGLSTVSINKILRRIGEVKDAYNLDTKTYIQRVNEADLTEENLFGTRFYERIVTNTKIYYVANNAPVPITVASSTFTANEYGDIYFTGENLTDVEFIATYGINLVAKLVGLPEVISLDRDTTYTAGGLNLPVNKFKNSGDQQALIQFDTISPTYNPQPSNKMIPLRVWGQQDITNSGNSFVIPSDYTGYLFFPKYPNGNYTRFQGQCAWLYKVDFKHNKYAVTSEIGSTSSCIMVGLDKDLKWVGALITNYADITAIQALEPQNNYCITLGTGSKTLTKYLIDASNFPDSVEYVIVKDSGRAVTAATPSKCELYEMTMSDTYKVVKDIQMNTNKNFVMMGGSVAWYGTQASRGNIVWNIWDKWMHFKAFTNYSVSGAGFWTDTSKTGDSTLPMQIYNHSTDIANADVAILWASTNDAGKVGTARGSLSDTIDITKAPNVSGSGCDTIYGGMKWCVEKLLSLNDKMKIIFFTSARCKTYMYTDNYEKKLVGDQIECAKHYGCPVFNQVEDFGMNNNNWWNYFDYTESGGTKTPTDGVHMNKAGYETLATLQTKFLLNH